MSYTVIAFITQAFRTAYQNEVLLSDKGDPFTVRDVQVGVSEDGLEINLCDRTVYGQNEEWLKTYGGLPYDVSERRSRFISEHDAMPAIVNLAWDRKGTKTWVPIKSRYERGDKPDPLNLP